MLILNLNIRGESKVVPDFITINVPLFKKMGDIMFFLQDYYF